MTLNILLLPGDGIGPEVIGATERIVDWFNKNKNLNAQTHTALIGGIAYDETGNPLPQETLDLADKADAVLLGAVGGTKWEPLPIAVRPEKGLLGIRKHMQLFANLRPALCFDALADASTLKKDIIAGLDIMIVRELTGGIYFGEPRGVQDMNDGTRRGYNTLVYTSEEVKRVGRVAFDLAKKRGQRVCSVDKANVLEATEMWREEMTKLQQEEYPEIELSHMYVDNASMQLVRNPGQFDVMVTTNMFGDILSDTASMLTGSLGMLPSASLGAPDKNGRIPSLYEPVHGSAPDIAGQNKANPLATILSFAMMLRYSFDRGNDADLLEQSVERILAKNLRTADIMGESSTLATTIEMTDALLKTLDEMVEKVAA